MIFATRLQSILTDDISNQFWRHFPARELQAHWLTLEVKYSRVWVSNHLILHSKLEMGLQLVPKNKTDLLSKDKLLLRFLSIYIPKIKNRRLNFPPPNLILSGKAFLTTAKIWPPDFQYINLTKV